jgi:hypothetical protein
MPVSQKVCTPALISLSWSSMRMCSRPAIG